MNIMRSPFAIIFPKMFCKGWQKESDEASFWKEKTAFFEIAIGILGCQKKSTFLPPEKSGISLLSPTFAKHRRKDDGKRRTNYIHPRMRKMHFTLADCCFRH
jgi:hypothetical protein